MALRANGTAGNFVARTGSMPTWEASTYLGQVKIAADLNVETAFMQVKDSSARFLAMYTNADGTSITLFDDYGSTGTNGVSIHNLTAGKFYGVAIRTTTGRAAKMYVLDHATGTVYTNGGTMNAAYTGALSEIRLGNYAYGSAANAAYDGWKMYDAALSDDEVVNELKRKAPVRRANLTGWWPMIGTTKAEAIKDFTGTGNLVETGTAFAVEDGSPTSWGGSPFLVQSSAAAASLTATLFSETDTFGTAVVGRGAVALTPGLLTDGDSFGTAVVTVGAVALSPTQFSSTNTFGTAVVGRGAVSLSPTLLSDGDTFGTPVVTAGSVDLAPTLYEDGDSFGAAVVLTGSGLITTLFVDDDSFGSPVVTPGAVTLTPTLLADDDAFGSAVITTSAGLTPTIFASSNTFGAATVSPGAVSLVPTLEVDDDSFGAPAVSVGTVSLVPTLVSDADSFFDAAVSVGAVSLLQTHFSDADTFGAHLVSLGTMQSYCAELSFVQRTVGLAFATRAVSLAFPVRTVTVEVTECVHV